MEKYNSAIRLTSFGWVMFVLFGGLVALGQDSAKNGLVFAIIGIALGMWVWFRRSLPALIVSLVLGTLHTIEQVAYTYAGITDHSSAFQLVSDIFGFVGGVILVTGAAKSVRGRRLLRAQSAT